MTHTELVTIMTLSCEHGGDACINEPSRPTTEWCNNCTKLLELWDAVNSPVLAADEKQLLRAIGLDPDAVQVKSITEVVIVDELGKEGDASSPRPS